MCNLIIILFLYGCATITAADLDVKSEPQCLSRFDYEFKLVQKLAEIESEQKEIKKVVQDLTATKTDTPNYRMAFSAALSPNTADLNQCSTVVFDHVTLNIGNNYDPQHGVFTATHKGLYFFTVTAASPVSAQLLIMKNNKECAYTFDPGQKWGTGTASVSLQLDPGDRVWVEGKGVIHGYDGYIQEFAKISRTLYHSSFTGFLITTL